MTVYLPSELIELISLYLPNTQQYQCLFVSKSWYSPYHRSLYKTISIHSRPQLISLFLQLYKKGSLVRKIYLNKSIGITRKELDQLAFLCPYLEILDFDETLWKYLAKDTANMLTQQFQHLKQLPTLTRHIPTVLDHLTRLDLKGKIVSDLFQHGEIIQVLIRTPKLKHLSLDSQQDISHAIYISLNEMESIHECLPHLETLKLIGSFKFNSSHITPQHQVIQSNVNMRHLTLEKVTLPHQWIYYIAHKYPKLQEIDFELIHLDPQHDKKQQEVMKNEEIQNLFSILCKSCPSLRKMVLDSASAKLYLTRQFFDTSPALKEIKLKDVPYHVVTREDEVFDVWMEKGKYWITGLTAEVIGSDQHILSLLNPISQLSRLTELVLHCGHAYYDCELDLVLKACPQILNLTIRSAHITLSSNNIQFEKYPLQSLFLSNTRLSSPVFDYLGKTCESMDTLQLYECEQDDTSHLNIYMPNNRFQKVTMNGIRLNSVSHNARFLSIQTEKYKRWYYAINRKPCHPHLQRLNHRKSFVAQTYHDDGLINKKEEWIDQLLLGTVSLYCKSIQHWELLYHTNYIEF